MKRILTVLSVAALVAVLVVFAATVQPAVADSVHVNVGKVLILGGQPGTYVSAWQAGGAATTDSAGQPIGIMEGVTPISGSGQTEIFVPWGQVSNVFIWDPSQGYTFLQTVSPNNRGDQIVLTAK
jgi:hypothetical protein